MKKNSREVPLHKLTTPTPMETIDALINYRKAKGLPTITRHQLSDILIQSKNKSNKKLRKSGSSSNSSSKLPQIQLNGSIQLGMNETLRSQNKLGFFPLLPIIKII
jgi:glutaredoxin